MIRDIFGWKCLVAAHQARQTSPVLPTQRQAPPAVASAATAVARCEEERGGRDRLHQNRCCRHAPALAVEKQSGGSSLKERIKGRIRGDRRHPRRHATKGACQHIFEDSRGVVQVSISVTHCPRRTPPAERSSSHGHSRVAKSASARGDVGGNHWWRAVAVTRQSKVIGGEVCVRTRGQQICGTHQHTGWCGPR